MKLKSRLMWRGRTRANLRDMRGDISAAIAQQVKYPTQPFLDSATEAAMNTVLAWIATKLAQRSMS